MATVDQPRQGRADFAPNLEPRIPHYVSEFGPRAMGLAGAYGDGLVFAIPLSGVPVAEAPGHARQDTSRANRAMTGFHNPAQSSVAMLKSGKAADPNRIKMASVGYYTPPIREPENSRGR